MVTPRLALLELIRQFRQLAVGARPGNVSTPVVDDLRVGCQGDVLRLDSFVPIELHRGLVV